MSSQKLPKKVKDARGNLLPLSSSSSPCPRAAPLPSHKTGDFGGCHVSPPSVFSSQKNPLSQEKMRRCPSEQFSFPSPSLQPLLNCFVLSRILLTPHSRIFFFASGEFPKSGQVNANLDFVLGNSSNEKRIKAVFHPINATLTFFSPGLHLRNGTGQRARSTTFGTGHQVRFCLFFLRKK